MNVDDPALLPSEATTSAGFLVEMGGKPGVLARILEAFARRDIAIDTMAYVRAVDTARLEAIVHSIAAADARHVAGQIGQVIGVTRLDVRALAKSDEPAATHQVGHLRLCA